MPPPDRLVGQHDFAAFCKRREGDGNHSHAPSAEHPSGPVTTSSTTVRADASLPFDRLVSPMGQQRPYPSARRAGDSNPTGPPRFPPPPRATQPALMAMPNRTAWSSRRSSIPTTRVSPRAPRRSRRRRDECQRTPGRPADAGRRLALRDGDVATAQDLIQLSDPCGVRRAQLHLDLHGHALLDGRPDNAGWTMQALWSGHDADRRQRRLQGRARRRPVRSSLGYRVLDGSPPPRPRGGRPRGSCWTARRAAPSADPRPRRRSIPTNEPRVDSATTSTKAGFQADGDRIPTGGGAGSPVFLKAAA